MTDDPRWYLPGLTSAAGIAQLGQAPAATRAQALHKVRGYADALDTAVPAAPKLLAPFDGRDGDGTPNRKRFGTPSDVAAEVVRLRAAADQIEALA